MATAGCPATLDTVDRQTALARLTGAYATAITLHDRGLDDAAIAERLGIVPEAVPALLDLAAAKLARLTPRPGRVRAAQQEEQPAQRAGPEAPARPGHRGRLGTAVGRPSSPADIRRQTWT